MMQSVRERIPDSPCSRPAASNGADGSSVRRMLPLWARGRRLASRSQPSVAADLSLIGAGGLSLPWA
jgi:hypothetical protein